MSLDLLVDRRGRVSVPVVLRRKYGLVAGSWLLVEDTGSSLVLRVIHRFQDLIGVDANKKDYKKTNS